MTIDWNRRRHSYDFDSRNTYSLRKDISAKLDEFYLGLIPGATSVQTVDFKTHPDLQRKGVDKIVKRAGKDVTIDEKIRAPYIRHTTMLLELHSDYDAGTPGWATDDSKISDFIAYVIPQHSLVYWLPYRPLRRAVQKNAEAWIQHYNDLRRAGGEQDRSIGESFANNKTYGSHNLCMPIKDVLEAITYEMNRYWTAEDAVFNLNVLPDEYWRNQVNE